MSESRQTSEESGSPAVVSCVGGEGPRDPRHTHEVRLALLRASLTGDRMVRGSSSGGIAKVGASACTWAAL